jgi:hypothetical protein
MTVKLILAPRAQIIRPFVQFHEHVHPVMEQFKMLFPRHRTTSIDFFQNDGKLCSIFGSNKSDAHHVDVPLI